MPRTKLSLCSAFAILTTLALGTAFAQGPADQRTYFTFSAPFELPGGKTLPAGKYTFKIVDSPSNRHVVQIMNANGSDVLATMLAIPAQRAEPPDEPEVRFMETAANMPPAIRTWWYPGRTIGHELIYPKDQARRLAARQTEPVLTITTDASTSESMRTAALARINATGQETTVTAEAARAAASAANAAANTAAAAEAAVDRTARAVNTAVDRTAAAVRTPAPVPAPAPDRRALPQTSTLMPLVSLLGLASLVGAGALRLRRK